MKFRQTATRTLLGPGLAGLLYALPLPTCLVSRRHRMLFASCSESESLSTKIVALMGAAAIDRHQGRRTAAGALARASILHGKGRFRLHSTGGCVGKLLARIGNQRTETK